MSNEGAEPQSSYSEEHPYAPHASSAPAGDYAAAPVLKELPPPPISWRSLGLLATLAAIFIVGDLAIVTLMRVFRRQDWGAVLVYCAMGGILAQGGLSQFALVFAPGAFWKRLLGCCGVVGLLYISWAIGLAAARSASMPGDFRRVGFPLPLVAVAAQTPLWFFRLYLGWRLKMPAQSDAPPRPLSIGDYMTGTAIVAASLTLARLVPGTEADPSGYWFAMAMMFAAVAGLSLISVVPAMLLTFRIRRWELAWGALLVYALIATTAVLQATAALFGTRGPFRSWELLGITLIFVSFAGLLGLGMKVARDLGYELITSRNVG
jgi:hypothetical protein